MNGNKSLLQIKGRLFKISIATYLNKLTSDRKELIFLTFVCAVLLIFGLLSLDNYGIHVDDFSLATYGRLVTNNLVDPGNNNYAGYGIMRFYSPFFETFSHILISYLGIQSSTLDYFYARKVLIYLTFLAGLFFYYLLLRKFLSRRTSLLSTASVYLIPSFFGYASVTSKEIPLLSFTIISIYFLMGFVLKHSYRNLVWHYIFLGIAIAVRPSAISLLPLSFLSVFFSSFVYQKSSRKSIFQKIAYSLLPNLLVLLTIVPSFILDPYLRINPIGRYLERLEFMSTFDMGGSIMIMGEVMKISESRTIDMFLLGLRKTPETFIILAIVGLIYSLYLIISKKYKYIPLILMAALWLLIPLILIFVKETKFYNFRHLLIFIPPLGVFLSIGIDALLSQKNVIRRQFSQIFIIIGILASLHQIYTLYPYEVTYFNRTSGGLKANSELYINYPEGLAEAEAIKKVCVPKEDIAISGPFVNIYLPYYCPSARYTENYSQANYIITYDFYEELIPVPIQAKLVDSISRNDASLLNTYMIR